MSGVSTTSVAPITPDALAKWKDELLVLSYNIKAVKNHHQCLIGNICNALEKLGKGFDAYRNLEMETKVIEEGASLTKTMIKNFEEIQESLDHKFDHILERIPKEMIRIKEYKLALMYLKEITSLLNEAKWELIATSRDAEFYNIMMEEYIFNIFNWAYEKTVDRELSKLVVQVEKLSQKIQQKIKVEHEKQETSV